MNGVPIGSNPPAKVLTMGHPNLRTLKGIEEVDHSLADIERAIKFYERSPDGANKLHEAHSEIARLRDLLDKPCKGCGQ